MNNKEIKNVCWYCGAINSLVWQSDFNYDEVYGEGEGIVTYLHCMNEDCGANVEYSLRTDKVENLKEISYE